MKKEKNILFITGRPYQILISIMFAKKLDTISKSNIYLLIIDECNNIGNIYKDWLNSWEGNPFNEILIIPLKYNRIRILHNIEDKMCIKKIKKITENIVPYTVYTSNDISPFFQASLQIQQKLNSGKAIYIEDGLMIYVMMNMPSFPKIRKYLKRYIYGNNYTFLSDPGYHPQITEMYVNYPELIDKEKYAHLKINKIDKSLYNIFNESQFVAKLIGDLDCNIYEKLANIKFLIILPHPENEIKCNKCFVLYTELIKLITEKNYNFAIKYHPTDYSGRYSQIRTKLMFEIPNYLPIEIIYIMLRNINQNIHIIGDSSSAVLITPGVLLPKAKVYSLIKMIDTLNEEEYKQIIEKFKNKIKMVSTLREIGGL